MAFHASTWAADTAGTAKPASPPITDEQLSRLIAALGSPSRKERTEAETTLRAAGPALLERLPDSNPDPAIKEALERLWIDLELQAARQAGQPGLMTLEGTHTLKAITGQIHQQTGNLVEVQTDLAARTATVNWKAVPFWAAVEELESSLNLKLVAETDQSRLLLKSRTTPRPISSINQGPVRFEVLAIQTRPHPVSPEIGVTQVRWKVRLEPRLRPLFLIVADRDASLNQQGQTYLPFSPDSRREIPCDQWEGCEVDTVFQTPADLKTDGLSLSARMSLKTAALPLDLRFADLASPSPAPQRRGAVTGQISNLRRLPDRQLSLDLDLAYHRGGPEFESHRTWIFQNAVRLQQRGQSASKLPASTDLLRNTRTGGTLSFLFENMTAPVTDLVILCEAPSLIIDLPISVTAPLGLPAK